jgi:hypothetical protein
MKIIINNINDKSGNLILNNKYVIYIIMLFDEYYNKQLEIQRDMNKNIVEKFKELEKIINDNNNYINDRITNIKNEVIQEQKQEQIYSYNPINYIAIHLFYGFLLYEGVYYMSKVILMNVI